MKCKNHPNNEASALCKSCLKLICSDCAVTIEKEVKCVSCVQKELYDSGKRKKSLILTGLISFTPFIPIGFNYAYLGHLKKSILFVVFNILMFTTFVLPGVSGARILFVNIYFFVVVMLRLFTFAHCLLILKKQRPIPRLGTYYFVIICLTVMFSLTFAVGTIFTPVATLNFWGSNNFLVLLSQSNVFFIPSIGITLGIGIILLTILLLQKKPESKQVSNKEEVQNITQDVTPVSQELLDKQALLWELANKLQLRIHNFQTSGIRMRIQGLYETTKKISQFTDKYPNKLRSLNKFIDYYIPTTLNLLDNYKHLKEQGKVGNNVAKATEKIEDLLNVLQKAYDNQLDELFEDKSLDIDTEVSVLISILEKEGLLQNMHNSEIE